jgi:hypothetical protein
LGNLATRRSARAFGLRQAKGRRLAARSRTEPPTAYHSSSLAFARAPRVARRAFHFPAFRSLTPWPFPVRRRRDLRAFAFASVKASDGGGSAGDVTGGRVRCEPISQGEADGLRARWAGAISPDGNNHVTVPEATYRSYCRALRSLVRAGLVTGLGCSWRDKRRRYALPDVARAYQARVMHTFGSPQPITRSIGPLRLNRRAAGLGRGPSHKRYKMPAAARRPDRGRLSR